MIAAAEAFMAAVAGARGTRPQSLTGEETEKILAMTLALLVEMSSVYERLDRLERELAESRGLTPEEWKDGSADANADTRCQDEIEAMQLRVLRILVDPRHADPG